MSRLKIQKSSRSKLRAKTPPDMIREVLDHLDYRESYPAERKQDIRFAAADYLLEAYLRLMSEAPEVPRRNMGLHMAEGKILGLSMARASCQLARRNRHRPTANTGPGIFPERITRFGPAIG
ncbi:hypothetical protein [Roseicella sp. DB1501]|uniref:hypothetical protein n=1 Tax=Roseicella sp. DB1501 TaxID=2730925 RepID=UPI001492D710|nr:hypothetical protein [Roseicella sp. DB1501]NOG73715.1 hypothetical protein [Roseicella sp. DB1501]